MRGGAFSLSSGERLSFRNRLSAQQWLTIRGEGAKASLPLPDDVVELLGVDEDTATGAIALRLGRLCKPDRKVTIAREELRGRLLAERPPSPGESAEQQLRRAVEMAPHQADLRIRLLLWMLENGQSLEAERVLQEGLHLTPFEVAWLARQQPPTEALITKVAGDTPRVDLEYGSGEYLPTGAAWDPARRLAAFVDERETLRVTSKGNVEVFAAKLAFGRDFDADGGIVPGRRKIVAARVAAAGAMLGQLGFRQVSSKQHIAAKQNDDSSWVQAKDRSTVAVADEIVIRVRQRGRVVFKEQIDTVGTIVLDWGVLLPEEHTLLLRWSRKSGNDECPNGMGISQVPLSSSLAAPSPASSFGARLPSVSHSPVPGGTPQGASPRL